MESVMQEGKIDRCLIVSTIPLLRHAHGSKFSFICLHDVASPGSCKKRTLRSVLLQSREEEEHRAPTTISDILQRTRVLVEKLLSKKVSLARIP